MKYKVFESSEGNVFKYVFTTDDAVAEAVLYRYNSFYDRTVICCSVMSGCPVGCTFCGTGRQFIRNLTSKEIVYQIDSILSDKQISSEKIRRFQIMFMSMGEPLLNWINVEIAIRVLNIRYTNADLLISTIAPVTHKDTYGALINISKEISKIGLQFSIHKSTDSERDKLIPYKDKLPLADIRDIGLTWWNETGRYPYLNYCIDGTNNTDEDIDRLTSLFSPLVFNFTFSVVCSADETMKDAGYRNLNSIRDFENKFKALGYNTRIFNPAGQDDIGGGCGQLWYVQKWIREHKS